MMNGKPETETSLHSSFIIPHSSFSSAVADRTARFALDLVLLQVHFRVEVRGRLPGEVEDLLARPHVLLRLAVAVQTPVHVQRVHLPGQRHLIDAAVTGDTTDPLFDVNAVVEVDEARQLVDAVPFQRRAAGPVTLADGSQHRAAEPDLRMAVHARLARRHAGKGRLLDGGVAVAAVDLELADMMAVAERYRLLDGGERVGVVGGAHGLCADPAQRDEEENRAEDADSRDDVKGAMKDLGHRRLGSSMIFRSAGARNLPTRRGGAQTPALRRHLLS